MLNVLASVKMPAADSKDNLETAAEILDSLTDHTTEDDVSWSPAEYLRLISKNSCNRRYSTYLPGSAVCYRTSPKLYSLMTK